MGKSFYIVDGHSELHRCYHAPFSAKLSCRCFNCGGSDCVRCCGTGKEPTKATYLFISAILSLANKYDIDYLAVAVDGSRDDLRRRALSLSYKNRGDPPPDFQPQRRRSLEILKLLEVKTLFSHGYEADDVIATLVHENRDKDITIISRDKDLMALVGKGVKLYDAVAHEKINSSRVRDRLGVSPKQVPDLLALMGDKADGISGVQGWGKKLASRFLLEYGMLSNLIEAAETGDLPTRLGESLIQARDSGTLKLAQRLIRLEKNVPLPMSSDELLLKGLNLRRAKPLFRKLGFNSLL